MSRNQNRSFNEQWRSNHARANIFRRDQRNVVDIKSAQEFSRYNGMYLGQFSYMSGHNHSLK